MHVIDNFATGSVTNVAHVMSHPRFRLQRHDVETALSVVPAVKGGASDGLEATIEHFRAVLRLPVANAASA